uniref:Phosducin-like protein n=1 Tax=Ailuropoda melanoleuca TaxID=9646 RepID=A0A7N5JKI9_AILME
MTTLDDKLLGEKLQYYYSSSDEEDSEKDDNDNEGSAAAHDATVTEEMALSADGSAINTAPRLSWRRWTK